MAGHGEKRSRKAELAIAALLSEDTVAAAAEKAGVAERTLLRWLAKPAFRKRYRNARRAVVETMIAGLQKAGGEAVETLRRNLRCGDPGAENRAAVAIILHALKGAELSDLTERVEELERLTHGDGPAAAGGQAADPGPGAVGEAGEGGQPAAPG